MTGGVLRGKLEVNATDTVIVAPAQWEEPIRADTLDAAGNRTNEKLEILAGGWETKSDTDFVYSTRCELDQIIRAPGTEDESVTEYDYDCNGNLERVWDANNPSGGKVNQASQFYVYDDLNRLFSITQPWTGMGGDAVTSYGYDVQDHLTSLTDAEGNTTTYVYSDRGLMTFQDSPVSGDTTFAYNEHGELISQTDGRGITVNRGTDALDRVTTVTYPTQSELDTTYTYDDPGAPFSVGRLTKIERGASAVSYAYDRFGRLTQDGDLGYGYDDNGNRSEITYPGGVVATYSHDFADRPETLTVDDGVNPPPHRNVVTAATYLPSGPLSDLTLGNGINETRVFDSRYFPESIATSGLDERTWSYFTDDVGNITRIDWTRQCIDQVVLTDTTLEGAATFIACSELRAGPAVDVVPPGDVTFLAGSKVFLRDGFRLQGDAELHVRIDPGVVTPELSTLTYAYQPHQYFLTDAYGPWGDLEWTYDRIGNRLTETRDGMEDNYTYSPAGSPILASIALAVGGTRNYNYGPGGSLEDVTAGENQIGFSTDAEGRLSALERPAASEQVAFDYDGRSFLDRVERPLAAPDLGWLEPLYSSDGTLQGLKRQPVPTDPVEETFFFTFSGRPVAQLKQVDGTNTWTFFTTDHLGTPMVASDLAGQEIWVGPFEPFGEDPFRGTAFGASESGVALRFPGQWDDDIWQEATEGAPLYYNLHRWLEYSTGRYTRADPVRLIESGVNPYLYVEANPLSYVDPFGLRYVNLSCRAILYKPEEDGPAEFLPSGGEVEKADGFYENCGLICGTAPGGKVFKTRDDVDIIFEGGCGFGKCVTWRYESWNDAIRNNLPLPGRERGGWKDDSWTGQEGWPEAPDCCLPINLPTEPPAFQ